MAMKTMDVNEEKATLMIHGEPGMAAKLRQIFKNFLSVLDVKEQTTIYK